MSLTDFMGVIVALGAFVGAIALMGKYALKGLNRQIDARIRDATKELRSNDGQSMKDQVRDIHAVMVPPSRSDRTPDDLRYRD
jgi:hypothetical protein